MNITNYWRNKKLDWEFRAATLAKPTAWWLAFFSTAPNVNGGGVELTGSGYGRVNLAPSDSNWFSTQATTVGNSSGSSGRVSNAVTITLADPLANWLAINGFGLMDASVAGNMCYWLDFALADPVQTPIVVRAGEGAITIPPTLLSITQN